MLHFKPVSETRTSALRPGNFLSRCLCGVSDHLHDAVPAECGTNKAAFL